MQQKVKNDSQIKNAAKNAQSKNKHKIFIYIL